jgi:hypothetical protein
MGQLRVVMRTWSRKSRKVRHRFAASTIQICGRRVTRRAREWKAWILFKYSIRAAHTRERGDMSVVHRHRQGCT